MIDEKSVLAVRPENMNDPVLTFRVNRMNIEGGGTLVPYSDSSSLVSLEWLEPASPSINLDEWSLTATCPKCHAVQPPMAKYSEAPTETEHECPICLETKQCRLLNCKHVVCSGCWTSWRSVACGGPVRPPMIDPEQLKEERAKRLREVLDVLPPQLSGLATKPGDSDKGHTEARKTRRMVLCNKVLSLVGLTTKPTEAKWSVVLRSKLLSLVEDSHNGEEGLGRFWEELMVFPVPFFCLDHTFNVFLKELDIPALEILLQVFEDRKDESFAHITKVGITVSFDDIFEQRCCNFCNRIGEKYEEVKNYRASILWYERSLAHSKCKLDPSSAVLYTQHCNLGLAQKKAGLLSAALENYNASLQLEPRGAALENSKMLLREMKAWTGSSGKLTPGC